MSFRRLAAFVGLIALVGCQRTPPPRTEVQGVVTLDGQPLPHAELVFAPILDGFGGELMAHGISDAEGRFTMKCGNQDGACVGEHRVTVADGPVPEEFRGMSAKAQVGASKFMASLKNRPIPTHYATFAQSPLRVTVKPDQKNYPIELTRKPK